MPVVAVKGSSVATGHPCDGATTLDTPSQSKVFAGGKLVASLGDPTVVHQIKVGDPCVPHTASIGGSAMTEQYHDVNNYIKKLKETSSLL
jgi:hypothetical protein